MPNTPDEALKGDFRIIVVERIPEDLLEIKRILESHGIANITFCTSAILAKDMLASGDHYDLAFIDDLSPKNDISGIEFCREIKHRLGFSMPVLFLTSVSKCDEAIELMRTGAHGFISKPFHERVVMNHVKSALKINAFDGRRQNVERGLKQNQIRFQISPQQA